MAHLTIGKDHNDRPRKLRSGVANIILVGGMIVVGIVLVVGINWLARDAMQSFATLMPHN